MHNAKTMPPFINFLNPVLSIWGIILLVWFIVLCVVPDPRPFGAPDWAVNLIRSVIGVSESVGRVLATIALRGAGLGMIGILLSLSYKGKSIRIALPTVFVLAPLLAIAAQWINYGYFPITPQLRFGVASAVLGALVGLAFRRNWYALVALIVIVVGLFAWGTSTGIKDDLYEAARVTGLFILENAEDTPKGDEGFAFITQSAFSFAENNSHGRDAILPNKAAILALGVILGEDRVAVVAKRPIELKQKEKISKLRNSVTLQGRQDLSRHFWVSAALTVLSNKKRSTTVGIAKEMKDATPGGSGFSFVDLMADFAGNRFAEAATRNQQSARDMQLRIDNEIRTSEFLPGIEGLPEGIPNDEFQKEYGGLGGSKTNSIVKEIMNRLAKCEALQ